MQVVADGKATYANQGKAKVGTVLYRVVWKDFPPDLVWYEPEDNLGDGHVAAQTRAAHVNTIGGGRSSGIM